MNHETVTELLPWYVNGTLPPHERAAVEAELASCPLCAAELAHLQRIHAALHEIDQDAPGPSESLMSRTFARIDAQPQRKGAAFSLRAWWSDLSTLGKATALVPAALAVVMLFAVAHSMRGAVSTPTSAVQPAQFGGTAGITADSVARQAKTLSPITTRSASGMPQNEAAQAPVPAAPLAESNQPLLKQNQSIPNQLHLIQRPQLIRTGNIDLLVPDVERALVQLQALAQAQFGDVVSLNDETPSQPGVRHTAQVQLSIPADRFDQTMDALVKMGAVQTRTISAENVSDQIVDGQARLRNLRRTEADMLRILDRAGKIPDVLDVTQQIAQVREQIEQLDAQVRSLQHQVAYSTISIGIEDEKPIAVAEPGVGTQLGDAWKAATRDVRNFTVRLASAALVVFAFAPYWLVVALIALFVANRLRR